MMSSCQCDEGINCAQLVDDGEQEFAALAGQDHCDSKLRLEGERTRERCLRMIQIFPILARLCACLSCGKANVASSAFNRVLRLGENEGDGRSMYTNTYILRRSGQRGERVKKNAMDKYGLRDRILPYFHVIPGSVLRSYFSLSFTERYNHFRIQAKFVF